MGNNPDGSGSWNYWADYNHTRRLTVEEVSMLADNAGSIRFYTDWEWHAAHCVYYWEKAFRARSTGVKVEPRYDTIGHIRHCGKLFFVDRRSMSYADVTLLSGRNEGASAH